MNLQLGPGDTNTPSPWQEVMFGVRSDGRWSYLSEEVVREGNHSKFKSLKASEAGDQGKSGTGHEMRVKEIEEARSCVMS